MCISDILVNSLTKENQGKVVRIAQYFYCKGRCSYSTFLFVITKPFY